MNFKDYAGFWFVVSLLFFVASLVLMWLIWKQARALNRTRLVHAELALLGEFEKALEPYHSVYSQFCEDGFSLRYDDYSAQLKTDVRLLIRALTRIGVLLQSGVFDHSPVVSLHGDFCIRSWLMLKSYIDEQRKQRQDPAWIAPMQYLTAASLESRLRTKVNPLIVYHPTKGNPNTKEYQPEELRQMLRDLKAVAPYHPNH